MILVGDHVLHSNTLSLVALHYTMCTSVLHCLIGLLNLYSEYVANDSQEKAPFNAFTSICITSIKCFLYMYPFSENSQGHTCMLCDMLQCVKLGIHTTCTVLVLIKLTKQTQPHRNRNRNAPF